MTHPLVDQFRFTRSEWLHGLEGVTEEDAAQHFGLMNCIGWIVGHLAWHEQRTFLQRPQNIILFPHLNEIFAVGAPMSTPRPTQRNETGRPLITPIVVGSSRVASFAFTVWNASPVDNRATTLPS